MKVFIEAERNSSIRTRYNEQSFELLHQFDVLKPYPFAYGFIPGTAVSVRDALDCFVITRKPIKTGETIECEPLDAFIQHENKEEDLKIIAVDFEEQSEYDLARCVDEIQTFILEIFKDSPQIKISFGPLLGKAKTSATINAAREIGKARTNASS